MFEGALLEPNNYWIKLSKIVPWAEFDNEYKEMKEKLNGDNMRCCIGHYYSGQKDCTVIGSESLKWVCSM